MKSDKGTYALTLLARRPFGVSVGRLGRLKGPAGYYVYVGSAFGPGGLKARLSHHLKPALKPRWHIDYLKTKAPITEIWYSVDADKREHLWADTFVEKMSGINPFPGFGSSDCACLSHLIYFDLSPSIHKFRRYIKQTAKNHAPIKLSKSLSL